MQDARQVEWSALRSGGNKRDSLVHRKNGITMWLYSSDDLRHLGGRKLHH